MIKNTFLSNSDNASVALRKELLENFDLHTILDLPAGTFQGAGVKTVVLFFKKGEPTRDIWYYQLDLKRSLGKTTPLNSSDLDDFVSSSGTQKVSENSWLVESSTVSQQTYDLSVRNPLRVNTVKHRDPKDILDEIEAISKESNAILDTLRKLL